MQTPFGFLLYHYTINREKGKKFSFFSIFFLFLRILTLILGKIHGKIVTNGRFWGFRMKRAPIFFCFLVIIFLFSGCGKAVSRPGVAGFTVQRIRIHCQGCESDLQREYTQQETMRTVLLWLRQLGPDFPATEDVDALPGRMIHLTFYCADGSRQDYRLKGNQYLQKNGGPWRKINADRASGLYQWLLLLPSDGPKNGPILPAKNILQKI